MKFIITREQFLKGLHACNGVVSSRATLPVLQNVLMRATDDNRLHIAATDLDRTIAVAVDATVAQVGSITAPFGTLMAITKSLSDGELEVELEGAYKLNIEAGPTKFKLNGLAAEEFPQIPKPNTDQPLINLSRESFSTLLGRTKFAVSTDESRYVLRGLFFNGKANGELNVVGTDGRRLALATYPGAGPALDCAFIVPENLIGVLARMAGASAGNVHIWAAESSVQFDLTDESGEVARLWSKTIEGRYPNYRKVIPADHSVKVVLPREPFLSALRRVELMTTDKFNCVLLGFERNKLTLSSGGVEVGESREVVDVRYSAKPLVIGFNPDYLIDAFEAIESDELEMRFTDGLSPGTIHADNFLYVLVPVKIEGATSPEESEPAKRKSRKDKNENQPEQPAPEPAAAVA